MADHETAAARIAGQEHAAIRIGVARYIARAMVEREDRAAATRDDPANDPEDAHRMAVLMARVVA